ncbi:MAG TPA: HAD-IB family phosphatase, partial [Thermoanaerobaculia bacterium]|nr:HAD-IB family phosphatase [Thermoanaerobaculia bacterium]
PVMLLYRHIFFDVDSTLVTIEGIDELAAGNREVARLTDRAMNGEIPIEDVYAARLDIIRPTAAMLAALAQQYVSSIVDGAEETVRTLREAGGVIHLVTAGIEQAVRPLGQKLGVEDVRAVRLRFDGERYAGFDPSPLTRNGGKELVVRDVRARTKGKAAMIGDGVSDLEAKPAVDLFIGFGGVHIRQRVKDNADVFVTDLPAVIPHLIA